LDAGSSWAEPGSENVAVERAIKNTGADIAGAMDPQRETRDLMASLFLPVMWGILVYPGITTSGPRIMSAKPTDNQGT
jgi:hypothetical protein